MSQSHVLAYGHTRGTPCETTPPGLEEGMKASGSFPAPARPHPSSPGSSHRHTPAPCISQLAPEFP